MVIEPAGDRVKDEVPAFDAGREVLASSNIDSVEADDPREKETGAALEVVALDDKKGNELKVLKCDTMDLVIETAEDGKGVVSEEHYPVAGGWQDVQPADAMSTGTTDSLSFDSDDEEISFVANHDAIMPVAKPFRIDLLKECIERGNVTLERVSGKDVVLVIGKTGSGKSTLIQGIAGRKFKAVDYAITSKGKSFKERVYEANDPLEGFDIGHAKSSQTNTINSYERVTGKRHDDVMCYVDSPGFEDTNGPEVDIATSVMLSEVSKRCKSLRFIVLINYASLREDRGGAMCSVLKFIRTFVRDFNKEKKSFVFLFAHTSSFLPDPIDKARERLLAELVHIDHGSSDGDVKMVLSFMRQSLEKRYPFVNIFHPIKTDIPQLVKFVETRLRPIMEIKATTNCGLTLSSYLKLVSEVQSLLLDLKRQLSGTIINTARVKQIQNNLDYLGRHIHVTDVKSAVQDCNDIIDRFCLEANLAIDREMARGTDMQQSFGAENVEVLRRAMHLLFELQAASAAHFVDRMIHLLRPFRGHIFNDMDESFQHVSQRLDKLNVWATGFNDLKYLYDGAVDDVHTVISTCTLQVVEFSANDLDRKKSEDILLLGKNLKCLGSALTHQEALASHSLPIEAAASAYGQVIESIHSSLSSWGSDIMLLSNILSHEDLLDLAIKARILEILKSALNALSVCDDLKESAESLFLRLRGWVLEFYDSVASAWKRCNAPLNQAMYQQLNVLKVGITYFEGLMDDKWRNMQHIYNHIVSDIRSTIMQMVRELEANAKHIPEHGIIDAALCGKGLLALKQCICFDNFLEPETFVNNTFLSLSRIYSDYMSSVSGEVEELLSLIAVRPTGSYKELLGLKKHVNSARTISQLATVLGDTNYTGCKATMDEKLRDYVHERKTKAEKALATWDANVKGKKELKNLNRLTQRIDTILQEMSLIPHFGLPATTVDLANELVYNISSVFSSFKTSVEEDFDNKIDYSAMAFRFKCMKLMGSPSMAGKLLPSYEVMKQKAINRVMKDARDIEELIAKSSNWDQIDILITKLEDADVIDEYIECQVSSRLIPLQKLREKKEIEVDSLLDELILKENFKGIGEFLAPLESSTDQLKRKKFIELMKAIKGSLQTRIKHSYILLEARLTPTSVSDLSESLDIIFDAKREIGKYFKGHLFDLTKECDSLTTKIDSKLTSLLEIFNKGVQDLDLFTMESAKQSLEGICDSICSKASKNMVDRMRGAVSKYGEVLDSVPSYVARVLNSEFAIGVVPLFKILNGLEKASVSHDRGGLRELYSSTKMDLQKGLYESFESLRQAVDNSSCYSDGIHGLQVLSRALNSGLNKHIDLNLLPYDYCSKTLEWQNSLDAVNKEVDFRGTDGEKKLTVWSKKMNNLKSPSLLMPWKTWITGATYKSHCIRLDDVVVDYFRAAERALSARDFHELRKYLQVSKSISTHLGRHVPNAECLAKKMVECIQREFTSLLESAQRSIAELDLYVLAGICSDLRGFIVATTTAVDTPSAHLSFSLFCQLVFDVLGGYIQSALDLLEFKSDIFDYAKIRISIEQARHFGNLVADHFTLLDEGIKQVSSSFGNKWLSQICTSCNRYFSEGRDLSNVKYFSLFGILPSASEREIRHAFSSIVEASSDEVGRSSLLAKEKTDFAVIYEAHEELMKSFKTTERPARPFDQQLLRINEILRCKVRDYLDQQSYEVIDTILFSLPALVDLKGLVSPEPDWRKIQDNVEFLVKNHVSKAKVEVDSLWAERKYRELNETIVDLKLMQQHFISHRSIFPEAWNSGIMVAVGNEIAQLGRKARGLISSKEKAIDNVNDFRRCFLQLGYVLVDLPDFKTETKTVMSEVLESCLNSEWGFGYLFDLGLSLQRGDDCTDGDGAHVAHAILSEFSHFKEVLTMVWNEETTQKPVEDTVERISAALLGDSGDVIDIDTKQLLESFYVFETQYKRLLSEFIYPEADLNALVHRIHSVCEKLGNVNCTGGWNECVRDAIPEIMAGVFAVFTIRKSGKSYNRIGSSEETSSLQLKILLTPHNIQVLTLLYMFGCGSGQCGNLDSQLLQIRTGEGKSIILGAAAAILALLGFRVRCVCYSEYLSRRDNDLFREVFIHFGIAESIKYSKITTLSEDSTRTKGDLRYLTSTLIRSNVGAGMVKVSSSTSDGKTGNHSCVTHSDTTGSVEFDVYPGPTTSSSSSTLEGHRIDDISSPEGQCNNTLLNVSTESSSTSHESCGGARSSLQLSRNVVPSKKSVDSGSQEILLVDEVDVFFGSEFYGRTYDQVTQLNQPEVQDILKAIWRENTNGGRRQRLSDIKSMSAYVQLVSKFPGFEFMIDNEISLMLDDVRHFDDELYYLDNDRIGYKIMDSVCFGVTFGYRTAFAYLHAADAGKLKDSVATLENVLCMNVSCGQFSYANIQPTRILGVSGTLEAMSTFEHSILDKYGVKKFIYMPSVYGISNFNFDKAGDGIFIESSKSDFFHRICTEISSRVKQHRAVIVFFRDTVQLNDFANSPFYRKLGRMKSKLSEDLSPDDKDYVIKKASTAGQVTICSAVFGRGTDFFSKDKRVEDNGGVHIIQTFLSEDLSEEIQIQGRTARQGKSGTYQLIFLDSDLEEVFDIPCAEKERVPKPEWYDWLCRARKERYARRCNEIERNFADATSRDSNTHRYFDALLFGDHRKAYPLFRDIYFSMKKRPRPSNIDIDLCVAIDSTGSMNRFMPMVKKAMETLLHGKGSIAMKLGTAFPEIKFRLRVATLAFRDIEDNKCQFEEKLDSNGCHFHERTADVLQTVNTISKHASGGYDIAEDVFGAIKRCAEWTNTGDWTGGIKIILVMTDAPAHGQVPPCSEQVLNADNFPLRHPEGITPEVVVDCLVRTGVDLFFCSFNPRATAPTEENLSRLYLGHADNAEQREIISIPMVVQQHHEPGEPALGKGVSQHIIFVLDESGSMGRNWSGVVSAYQRFLQQRLTDQNMADVISVIQFSGRSRITCQNEPIGSAPRNLDYGDGSTFYTPPSEDAYRVALQTPTTHTAVVVFMSDGEVSEQDANNAASIFKGLNREIRNRTGNDLDLHVIAFGRGMDLRQLLEIKRASSRGRLHQSNDTIQLSDIFVDIASNSSRVATVLEAEIGRRISDVVMDKVSFEYLG